MTETAPLQQVARGTNQIAVANFRNLAGNAIVFASAPRYTVRDGAEAIIVSGIATQDLDVASLWRASFTIPADAPLQVGRWTLSWEGTDAKGGTHSAKEYFMVVDSLAPDGGSSDVLLIEGDPLSDSLIVDMPISAATIRLFNSSGQPLGAAATVSTSSPMQDGNGRLIYAYGPEIITGLELSSAGFNTFFANWRYTQNGASRVEVHAVYLMGGRMVHYVNVLRHYLDKARNFDVNPSLRWTDAELVHFVIEGINRINVTEPQLTNWNCLTVPGQMATLVTKAAAHEALNALYLAEGFSNFDFQGMSVQLNVDRTQFIQTKMDELNTWLEEHIRKAKKLLVKSSSVGHLAFSVGTMTNFPMPTQFQTSYIRTMLARAATAR